MLTWNETIWFATVLSLAVKSTAILAISAAAAWMLRRRSAAARHLVWTAAAAALLALPILSVSIPALPVRGAAASLLPPAEMLIFRVTATSAAPLDHGQPATQFAAAKAAPAMPRGSFPWQSYLMFVWAGGSAIALVRMLSACAVVWRLRRASLLSGDPTECTELARSLGIARPVELLETAAGSMPMTFGVLRPAVFLPSDAADWSEERRRIVLLHELAHVRRADVATQLLARTALTLYWWNPLAWHAWREFLKERERATDDLVLNSGAPATEYAGHLLSVALAIQASPNLGWAAIAMARQSQLEARLTAILDAGVNRHRPGRVWALALVITAAGIVGPLAALRAQDKTADTSQALPPDVSTAIRSAVSQQNPEILEDAAKAAERAKKFETEKQLLEPAVEIRGHLSGSHSVEYGMGLLKLGDLENKRRNAASAEDFYSRAAQILAGKPDSTRALVYLGISSLRKKDFVQAQSYFQQAQSADPTHAALAIALSAVALERDGKGDQAVALVKNALLLARPGSQDSVGVLELYGTILSDLHRTTEADDVKAQAAEAAKKVREATRASLPKSAALPAGVSGVSAPKLLERLTPRYTDEAKALKIQGTAILSVEIGPDGLAHNVQVLAGPGFGLDEAAADSVSQWRFEPGTKDGQPVSVSATIEVRFTLL